MRYWISDWVLFPLVYHVLRYRRGLVRRQMRRCGVSAEREFYHTLCDYIVEGIAMATLSRDEIRRRVQFVGLTEMQQQMAARGKGIAIVYLAHLGNWEWMSSAGLWLLPGFQFAQIYHPLHNRRLDKTLLRLRERWGGRCVSMRATLRHILRTRAEGRRELVGMIADQCPKREATHWWTAFMGQDTPFITGAEEIARRVDAAVYYLDITQPRRGHYRAELVPIAWDAAQMPPYAITERYAQLLEGSIRRSPHLWLWTHNRWKRARPQAQ